MMKKKLAAGLLSAALTLTMYLGLGTTVFAETGDNVTEAAITKNLQMDTNVTIPAATFTFLVEKASLDGSTADAELAKMPEIGEKTIQFQAADTNAVIEKDAGTGVKNVKKQTGNILPAANSFPHAGVYKYKVTEKSYTAPEGTDMNSSRAEFSMEIYVKNGTGGLTIDGVYVNYVKNDAGIAAGGKVDPTPGTGGDVSDWTFVNKFTKNGSHDDPDPARGALKIAKTVAGDMGDKTNQFHFTLTLNELSALEADNASYTGEIHRAADSTATATEVTLSKNAPASFTLADGEYLTFANLPVGTVYTVSETEKGQDGYTTTVETFSNGAKSTSETEVLVSEKANSVGYTNTKAGTVPTGILVNNLPFVLLILVAVCGFAGCIVFRRRKHGN